MSTLKLPDGNHVNRVSMSTRCSGARDTRSENTMAETAKEAPTNPVASQPDQRVAELASEDEQQQEPEQRQRRDQPEDVGHSEISPSAS